MQVVIIYLGLPSPYSGRLFINTSDKMGCKMQSDIEKKRVKISMTTCGSVVSHAERK